jgi:hypothetical protein
VIGAGVGRRPGGRVRAASRRSAPVVYPSATIDPDVPTQSVVQNNYMRCRPTWERRTRAQNQEGNHIRMSQSACESGRPVSTG